MPIRNADREPIASVPDLRSTEGLIGFAESSTGVELADLPAPSVAAARRVLFDDLGVIAAGHSDREVSSILEDWPLLPGAATIPKEKPLAAHPWSAAEVNALAGCWLELDGGFRLAPAHAGLYVVPVVTAVAEVARASLGEVLAAMVVGYELAARIAATWDLPAAHSHAHGSIAPAAAAAAASKIIGLDASGTVLAVSSAASMSMAAPFDHAVGGALVRNLWPAAAARTASVAVHTARFGVGGQTNVLSSVFSEVFGAEPWEGRKPSGEFGSAIQHAYHKAYSCCQYLHSSVEGAIRIAETMRDRGIGVDNICHVDIEIHDQGVQLQNRHPTTTLGGRFSSPHAVAAALVLGHARRAAFTPKVLIDPDVRRLREVTTVKRIDPASGRAHLRDAQITVELAHGERLSEYVDVPLGDPERPMTDADLLMKFEGNTGRSGQDFMRTVLEGPPSVPFDTVVHALVGSVSSAS
jgi:2-methylcitrate dehydratase PrpD